MAPGCRQPWGVGGKAVAVGAAGPGVLPAAGLLAE